MSRPRLESGPILNWPNSDQGLDTCIVLGLLYSIQGEKPSKR